MYNNLSKEILLTSLSFTVSFLDPQQAFHKSITSYEARLLMIQMAGVQ